MLRKILATLLMGTTVSAQVPLNKPLVARQASAPSAEIDSSAVYRESKVRAGHDVEVAIVPGIQALNCLDCLPTMAAPIRSMVIETVVLDQTPGFSIRYGERFGGKFKTTPDWSHTKHGRAALIKIHADKKVAAGDYELHGRAKYGIFQQGKSPEHIEVEVVVPITVVKGNEVVALNAWPYETYPNHHTRNTVLLILALPLILPYVLILATVCEFSPSECI